MIKYLFAKTANNSKYFTFCITNLDLHLFSYWDVVPAKDAQLNHLIDCVIYV